MWGLTQWRKAFEVYKGGSGNKYYWYADIFICPDKVVNSRFLTLHRSDKLYIHAWFKKSLKKVFQFSSNLEKKREAGSLRIKKLSSFRKKNKLSLVVQKLTTFQVFIIEYDKIKHIVLISRTRYTYSCSSRSYITVMKCIKITEMSLWKQSYSPSYCFMPRSALEV